MADFKDDAFDTAIHRANAQHRRAAAVALGAAAGANFADLATALLMVGLGHEELRAGRGEAA